MKVTWIYLCHGIKVRVTKIYLWLRITSESYLDFLMDVLPVCEA